MKYIPGITVFTPTYNRAYILNQLYESLCRQTEKYFVWLIVDDGSTDNTKNIVDRWIEENKINIKYYYQSNGGKMSAHNYGVSLTETELFMCVDSDDYLTNDAIEKILKCWTINKSESIAGIVALKGITQKRPIGTQMPNVYETTLSDLYNKYKFRGDTTLIFRNEIIKEYPFPQIAGEKFITEKYIYDQIDQRYKLWVLDSICIVCSYLDDGYSKNTLKIIKDNPKGWALFFNQCLKYQDNLTDKFDSSFRYVCMSLLSKDIKIIKKANNKALVVLAFPFGVMLYIKRRIQFAKLS
jgi:glycosyltransferase involved in cell wall biosynthesis